MVGVVGSAACLPLSRQYMLLHCCAVEWSGAEERGREAAGGGVARPTGRVGPTGLSSGQIAHCCGACPDGRLTTHTTLLHIPAARRRTGPDPFDFELKAARPGGGETTASMEYSHRRPQHRYHHQSPSEEGRAAAYPERARDNKQ